MLSINLFNCLCFLMFIVTIFVYGLLNFLAKAFNWFLLISYWKLIRKIQFCRQGGFVKPFFYLLIYRLVNVDLFMYLHRIWSIWVLYWVLCTNTNTKPQKKKPQKIIVYSIKTFFYYWDETFKANRVLCSMKSKN